MFFLDISLVYLGKGVSEGRWGFCALSLPFLSLSLSLSLSLYTSLVFCLAFSSTEQSKLGEGLPVIGNYCFYSTCEA